MGKDYDSAKSNTSPSVKEGARTDEVGEIEEDIEFAFSEEGLATAREAGEASGGDGGGKALEEFEVSGGDGGGKQPAREAAGDVRSQGDWGDISQDGNLIADGPSDPMGGLDSVVSGRKLKLHSIGSAKTDVGGGGSGSGLVTRTVGKTLGMAKTVIMAAVLISVAGAGVDVYQTYNDAIAIDLEKHITDADFELSDDKSEISGSVGFDIPEMGMFEKSIIASVHVTILESNPTTDGDYEFEYTLGSGEHFYDFTLDDLDPVTVEKIEAGEALDLEYSGTIAVTYLGVEIPSVTMDIPLTTTTVETA